MILSGITDHLFQLVNQLHERVDDRIEQAKKPEPLPKHPFPVLDLQQESLLRNWLNDTYPNRCSPIDWTNEQKIADTARREVANRILTEIDAIKSKQQTERAA